MGPIKELIVQDGEKAFYDEVVRYKNPHDDEIPRGWWYLGWDSAEEKHNLFSTNKRLILENEILEDKVEALEKDVLCKAESLAKYETIVSVDSVRLVGHEKYITELEEKELLVNQGVREIISSIESSNIFTFSREKIIAALKELLF
jgi:hypothetical protein